MESQNHGMLKITNGAQADKRNANGTWDTDSALAMGRVTQISVQLQTSLGLDLHFSSSARKNNK